MIRFQKILAPAAMALAMTGCNLVIVEDTPGPRANYFDGDFEFATHKGAIVTMVAGNPFGLPEREFADRVRREIARGVATGNAKFVAAAGDETVAPFKIVVAFNTAANIDNHNLCEQGAKTATLPLRGELNVKMAFCDGDNLKSGSAAWITGVSSVNDRGFNNLVRQAATSMIPAQDSEDAGESNFRN